MKVIVIGGGAAGFFTAINIAEKHPGWEIIILEKSSKLLQKVKVSGGGRCNVTNERSKPSELAPFYPRGGKKLHSLFKTFSSADMVQWLHEHGVDTKAEADHRMFPITDSSQTVIDCFLRLADQYSIEVLKNQSVERLFAADQKWMVQTSTQTFAADKVVVATGSSPAAWKVLENLGFQLTEVVPSLFTFNIKDQRIKDLQGVSFDKAEVKIVSSKLSDEGPLLITHWGLSGPAILKLSSWGAYELKARQYQFEILVNYLAMAAELARRLLEKYKMEHPKRKVFNYPLFDLPRRFWERMIRFCEISDEMPFAELSKKQANKLIEELTQGRYKVNGKSTFKEEFVTAGGIKLSEVDLNTFEGKRFPGLYLAGEILDIDALTGGFNFQACWSAGWVISESV